MIRAVLAVVLAVALIPLGALTARADPLPAGYSGTSHGDILDLDLGLLAQGVNVNAAIAHSSTAVDSAGTPRSAADGTNVHANAVGVPVAPLRASAESGPAAGSDSFDTGLAQVDVPGVLDTGLITTVGSTNWAGDTACVPDGEPIAESATSLADATLGVTLLGTLGLDILELGTVQTAGDTTLQGGSVVSSSSGNLTDLALLNGLVQVEVLSAPELTATSDGTTGSVTANEYAVSVSIAGGQAVTLEAGGSVPIELNIAGLVSTDLVLSVGALNDNSSGATGSGSLDFLRLSGSISALPIAGGAELVNLDLGLLPLNAAATGADGGVECDAIDAPTITAPVNGAETGGTPTISGTGIPGAVVEVRDGDDAVIGTAQVGAEGNWSLTPDAPLSPGEQTIVADQTLDDITSGLSNQVSFVVLDTVAPDPPVIEQPTDGSSTNDNTPTISGTAEAGTVVTVTDGDGNTLGTAPVDGTGNWILTPTAELADGEYTITATATDDADNTSENSDPVAFTVDTVAPEPVTIDSPADGSTISDPTPTISGTGEPGATVTVWVGDLLIGTPTVGPGGNWNVDVTEPLPDGSHVAEAIQTDEAGNPSSPAQSQFVIDTLVPAAPVIQEPVTGSSTADPTPTISGTAEPGASVTVTDADGTELGSATAGDQGDWSFDSAALTDGEYTITAIATDAAGNESPTSAPVTFIVDTATPDPPVITEPADGSTTGDSTPTIAGTGEPGATVEVTLDDAVIGTAVVNEGGDWTLEVGAPLADGEHTVSAIQTDEAGNASEPSAPVSFTVDTTAPDAPVIESPEDGALISDPTPTISGTAEPGSVVTVTDGDGNELGQDTANGEGSWSFDSSSLDDGTYTITATAVDAGDNPSPASESVTFTVDTTAPAAPEITGPADGSTIGTNTPVISGTGEPGATVEVSIDGTVVGTAEVTGEGSWSVPVTEPLADGDHAVSAIQTDPAGNVSGPATSGFTVDTTAAEPPVITAPETGSVTGNPEVTVSGTGTSGETVTVTDTAGNVLGTAVVEPGGDWSFVTAALDDGTYTITAIQTDDTGNESPDSDPVIFTVDTTAPDAPVITAPVDGSTLVDPTPTVSGTGEPGATVTVTSDGTELGTAVVDGSGQWTLPVSDPLSDGDHTLIAIQTDGAGNESIESDPVTITIDTGVPDAPVITAPADGAELTDPAPTIEGTGEPGATVEVSVDGQPIGTTDVDGDGNWSLDPSDPLSDGEHEIVAIQTDPAGNVSAESDPVTITIDATAPDAPVITAPTEGQVTDALPTVEGTGEPGATVEVSIDGTVIGTAEVDQDGNWAVEVTEPLTDGDHTTTAIQTDPIGNVSEPSEPVNFSTDSAAPAAPVITVPTDGELIAADQPTIIGTGEPGAIVEVTIDGEVVGTTQVNDDGDWSFTTPDPLDDGDHTVSAIQTDVTGNTSPPSAEVGFTIDTTAPAAPVITAPADGSLIADNTPTITGTGEPGSTVSVWIDGEPVGTADVGEDGSWSLELTEPLSDGGHTATAVQADPAGNTSEPSVPVSFDVDATAAAPLIEQPADGSSVSDDTPTISGVGEPGATVTVTIDGSEVGTAVVDEDGNWSFDPTEPLADGDHTVSAVQTDPAGNVSSPSEEISVTVDTAAPDAPVITAPTDGSAVNDDTPTIIGTGEPGATVTVTIDGSEVGTAVVDEDGNWSFDPTEPLADGDHTVSAVQTDPAGNDSSPSAEISFTVDTAAPDAPVITAPSDGATLQTSTPNVTGTGEPGSTVTVVDENGDTIGTAIVDDEGNWSLVTSDLLNGEHTITAIQADPAGNTSQESEPVTFTIDTIAPGAPIITSPGDGDVINDDSPPITGEGEPGGTVTIIVDGAEVGETEVDEDGNWEFELTDPLDDGEHTIGAIQTDENGNSSPPTEITVEVDTTVDPPTITTPADGSSIADGTPEITGTGEPGATVVIEIDGDEVGAVIVDDDGNWAFTPEDELDPGDHTISVVQTDEAGNISEPSTSEFTIVETDAPPPPVIISPQPGEEVDDTTPVVIGEGRPGASIGLIVDGEQTETTTVDENGNWSVEVTDELSCGQHTVSAVQSEMDLDLGTIGSNVVTSEPSDPVTFTVTCGDGDADGDGNGDGDGDADGDGNGDGDSDGDGNGDGDLGDTGAPNGLLPITLLGGLALIAGVVLLRRRWL